MYPDPQLYADLRSGDEVEGWVAFAVRQGEGSVMLIFEEWGSFDDDIRYLAFDEGASMTVDPGLEDITSTQTGGTADAPAAIGETIVAEGWQVTVLEAARGEQVWQQVAAGERVQRAIGRGHGVRRRPHARAPRRLPHLRRRRLAHR